MSNAPYVYTYDATKFLPALIDATSIQLVSDYSKCATKFVHYKTKDRT